MADRSTPVGEAVSVTAALEYAALSGPFDPSDALRVAMGGVGDAAATASVASVLARACDTNPDEGPRWVILGSRRREVLGGLVRRKALDAALERRREAGADEAASDLMDALRGREAFDPARLRVELDGAADPAYVGRVAAALERAGDLAPGGTLLLDARAGLLEIERRARRSELSERGFFGREAEIERMVRALEQEPPNGGLAAVFVSGLPGIGKSALLERVISAFVERHHGVPVRLDFDRAGLDATSPGTLLAEIARQVVDRLGSAAAGLREARLAAAGTDEREDLRGTRRGALPRRLLDELASSVVASARPLLIAVDTLEALEGRGTTHAEQLVDMLARLAEAMPGGLRILVAGRAAPQPSLLRRTGGQLVELGGLGGPPARAFLKSLDVAALDQEVILERAAGVPLALRLGAAIVRTRGRDELASGGGAMTSALLYRILLSRLDDERLRRLAHPGLIVRRISAEVLSEVLAPAVGLKLSDAEARDAFDALSLQTWLVEADLDDPSFVRHRGDMRSFLLPLLYADQPALCGRIDAAAVRWFGRRGDRDSALDALYHRLQLLRRSSSQPAVPADLAMLFDPRTVAELPERAQVAVRQAAGESSASFGLRSIGGSPQHELTRELRRIVAAQDWTEGLRITEGMRFTGAIDPTSALADAVRALWWRAGRWSDARWLLRERDRLGRGDEDLPDLDPQLVAIRVEMRGEFGPFGPLVETPALWRGIPPDAFDERLAVRGGGAFRARATGSDWLPERARGKEPDVVEAAFNRWSGDMGGAWSEAVRRAAEIQERSGVSAARARDVDWVDCQLVAALTPFAPVVATLVDRDRDLSDAAQQCMDAMLMGQEGALGLAGIDGTPQSGDRDPLASIADLGLLSEWSEAAAYLLGNPNLRSVAAASENWRRTMAGQWRYGPRPRGWGRMALDTVLWGRVVALGSMPRPRDAALAQLSAWAPYVGGADAVLAKVRSRSSGALRAAASQPHTSATAAALLRYRVPAAFVPSLVVILSSADLKWEQLP